MTINYEKLMSIDIPDVEQSYTERDIILYSLSIGVGHEPLNENALRYCYEKELRPLPTFPLVLAHPGFWMRDLDTGIDSAKVVHGEQSIQMHHPLPVRGKVVGKTRVIDIIDNGPGRGAIIVFERVLYECGTGLPIATMRQSNFCRGDGGFNGPPRHLPKPSELPAVAGQFLVDLPTRPDSALLYRLCADLNPLHVDPAVATTAGFSRPILHGLATFGIVGYAILQAACRYDNSRLECFAGRFVGPVYPGETIRTEIWCDGETLRFRASAVERHAVVITHGKATVRLAGSAKLGGE
jgi:acyl dehydratase